MDFNDNEIYYRKSEDTTSGLPAVKFFVKSKGASEVKGYLLVAGGRGIESKPGK